MSSAKPKSTSAARDQMPLFSKVSAVSAGRPGQDKMAPAPAPAGSSSAQTAAGSGFLSSWLGLAADTTPASTESPLKLYRRADEPAQVEPNVKHDVDHHSTSSSSAIGGGWTFDYGAVFSAVKERIAPPVEEEHQPNSSANAPASQPEKRSETIEDRSRLPATSRQTYSPPSNVPSFDSGVADGGGLVHRRKR